MKTNNFNIKISVIIPVYNAERYLYECLDSVINQSLNEIEILCINDGSTDTSLNILKEYAAKDTRIRIINKQNEGVAVARNLGINESKGEFLHFLDSDDTIDKDFYKNLYEYATQNSSDIALCNINCIYDSPNFCPDYFDVSTWFNGLSCPSFTYVNIKKHMLNSSWNIWNRLFKSSLIKENNITFPKIRILEDGIFTFHAMLKAKKVSFLNKKMYNYRFYPENTSNTNTNSDRIYDIFIGLDNVELVLRSCKEYNLFRERYYAMICSQINYIASLITDESVLNAFMEKAKDYCRKIPSKSICNIPGYEKNLYFKIMNYNSLKYTNIDTDNKIHIVLSTDNNYFRHLAVTLASILKNANSSDKLVFYILDGGISEENKYNLKSLKKIKDFEYFYITVDSEKFNSLSTGFCCGHVSKATYYRFLIPELFKHLDKVLYLDVDLIIKSSLRGFWETDLKGKYAAAVSDSGKELVQECMQNLVLSRYFNAGVMLFNVTKCASENICNTLFDNYKKLESENKLKCLDQDVLNYTFKENIEWLSPKYNLQTDIYKDINYSNLLYGENEVKYAAKKPVIIHYTTDRKPWLKNSDHKYKKEYFKYLAILPSCFKTTINCPLIKRIFSITNDGKHKVFRILGLKYKFKSKKLLKKLGSNENSFLEDIFSVKKSFDKKHKIITLFKVKLKLKRKNYLEEVILEQNNRIKHLTCLVNEQKKYIKNNLNKDITDCQESVNSLKNFINEKFDNESYQLKQNLSVQINTSLIAYDLHKKVFPPFKNINKNKEVILVASGPTIAYYDRIDAVHIGVNKTFEFSKISLDYLFTQDFNATKKYIEALLKYPAKIFLGGYFVNNNSWVSQCIIPQKYKDIPNVYNYISNYSCSDFFPDLSVYGLMDFGSVVFPAIHFAFYTNPSKIYIVGCDCSSGYFYNEKETNDCSSLINGWEKIKTFRDIYYPDTEIISVNPVGLKGMFKDVYTESYLSEHPEIKEELGDDIEILKSKEMEIV